MSGTTPSGTIASPGSGEPRGDSAAASSPRFAGAGTPVTLVIVAATVLALGLRLYWLSRPGFLLSVNEYDDGNYFGSAHGTGSSGRTAGDRGHCGKKQVTVVICWPH